MLCPGLLGQSRAARSFVGCSANGRPMPGGWSPVCHDGRVLPPLHVREGEEVYWEGRPDPRRHFSRSDVFWIPLSLVWTAFGLGIVLQWPAEARVLGLALFIPTAFFLVVGRYFVRAESKVRTAYVLTDTRAVIQRRGELFSFDLTSGSPHVEVIRRGRHCTLRFTSDDPRSYGSMRFQGFANTGLDVMLKPGRDIRFSFFDVRYSTALDAALLELVGSGQLARGIS